MVSLRPQDLPQLRDDLARFGQTDIGAAMFTLVDQYDSDTAATAESMTQALQLADATLFYVTPEMCELVDVAARTLPEFAMSPDDPPSQVGLAWLARPICDVTMDVPPRPIAACATSWITTGGTVRLSQHLERDTLPIKRRIRDKLPGLGFPVVFPMGAWDAPLDEQGMPVAVSNGATRHILAAIKTLWLLLRQPMTEQEEVVLPRPVRRRLAREGREPPPVRVIRLRRPPGRSSEPGEPVQWHHRWIVRGHWRQQPFGPGRGLRRPQWISPFVKGPEDAPLIGGEKVHLL